MGKRGRPTRTENIVTPLDHLEAFCCLQTERIERNLARIYGFDYDGMSGGRGTSRTESPGNRSWVMPQNEYFTRQTLMRDAVIDSRS